MRKELLSNIILVGGNSLYENMEAKIEETLENSK